MFNSDDEIDEDFLDEVFGGASECKLKDQPILPQKNAPASSSAQPTCITDKIGQKQNGISTIVPCPSPNNYSSIRRKFPGPAGILPERSSALQIVNPFNFNNNESIILQGSQASQSVLEDETWQQLLVDLGSLPPGREVLDSINIASIKRKATAKFFVGRKVPFLAAILHDIECKQPDPYVTLKDHTGEISGTLHGEVWQEFGGEFVRGCVLVFRNLGVLSIGVSPRRHYLNITANNLVTIYNLQQGNVCTHSIRRLTSDDFVTSMQEWLANVASPPLDPIIPNVNLSLSNSPTSVRNMSTPQLFNSEISSSSFKPPFKNNTISRNTLPNNCYQTKENKSLFSGSRMLNKPVDEKKGPTIECNNVTLQHGKHLATPRNPLVYSNNRIFSEKKTGISESNLKPKQDLQNKSAVNSSGNHNIFNMDITLEDFDNDDFEEFFSGNNNSHGIAQRNHASNRSEPAKLFQQKKPRIEPVSLCSDQNLNRSENVQLTLNLDSSSSSLQQSGGKRCDKNESLMSLTFNETLEDEKSIVDSVLDGIDTESLFSDDF